MAGLAETMRRLLPVYMSTYIILYMINKETASEYAKVIMMPEYGMSKDDEGFEDTYKKLKNTKNKQKNYNLWTNLFVSCARTKNFKY